MKHLKEGDKAPDFSGLNENGETIKLSDYKGKRLALFFYPKDSTPGCTMEACNLRDNIDVLKNEGIEVVGVSADSQKRHQNFIEKNNLPFPLIADTEREVIEAYGVWGLKKFMGREYDGIHRTTFVISPEGVIEHIIEKVKTKAHAEQIMELINSNE